MSVRQNKAILLHKHVEELLNKGNLAVADEIISPDYVYHGTGGAQFKGPEGVKQMIAAGRATFPDLHYTVEDMVGERDTVAVRYRMTGTFKGEFMGNPPTGKKIELTEAFFYRFKDGKQVEAIPFWDSLLFFRQMGIPIPQG